MNSELGPKENFGNWYILLTFPFIMMKLFFENCFKSMLLNFDPNSNSANVHRT